MLNYWIYTLDKRDHFLAFQPVCADNEVDSLIRFAEILDKTNEYKQIRIERKMGLGEDPKVVWMSQQRG